MAQKIHPAIIAQNQRKLGEDLKRLQGLVKEVHLDVVDGKFAPNHSLDFPFRLPAGFTYSTHLMIKDPEAWIARQGKKVQLYIPHLEALKDVPAYIRRMKGSGRKIALALLPETPVFRLTPFLPHLDYVLILTVHPGFYGSPFLPHTLRKIKVIKARNPRCKVIVDGGMNPQIIKKAARAGADYFVSGSYLWNAASPKKALQELQGSLRAV
ncbi:MAG: ribulose-phosphate 3-epimerase [Nanoarchaeota archaeon]|nr:ribulose-phosphate 3-epimerase [Nanoarchaeota archaeon]